MNETKREGYIRSIENVLKSDFTEITHEIFFTEEATREILELLKEQPERWDTCFSCPLSHGCPVIKGCTNDQAEQYAGEIPKDCPLDKEPAQPEQRWILCSERLPEDNQFVLITIRRMNEHYNHKPFISVGYIAWNQSLWWCAHDGNCEQNDIRVDAWMPLPEPYRKDGEADD